VNDCPSNIDTGELELYANDGAEDDATSVVTVRDV